MNQQVFGRDNLVENITITASRDNNGNLVIVVTNPNSPSFSGTYYDAPAVNIKSLTIRGTDDNETIKIEGHLGLGPNGDGSISIDGRNGDDTIVLGGETNGTISDLPTEVFVFGGGTGNYDQLVINDTAALAARDLKFTDGIIEFSANALLVHSEIDSLTYNGGNHNDLFRVESTGNMTTMLLLGGGTDEARIGTNERGLTDLAGLIAVSGEAGTDRLIVNDTGAMDGRNFSVESTTIQAASVASILYGTLEELQLLGGAFDDVVRVHSTAAGVATAVDAGFGNDRVEIGVNADTWDQLAGSLILYGGFFGTDTLVVDDADETSARTYVVTDAQVSRSDLAAIPYTSFEEVGLTAGSGDDQSCSFARRMSPPAPR